jgi:hypothetical protein
MWVESDRRSWGIAMGGRLGQAYDEKAFRYLLAIERERSERSGRPFLLLLVELKELLGPSERIAPGLAAKLFSGLWLCLRETDFIGWYIEDHTAGAMITQLAPVPLSAVSRLLRHRVRDVLRQNVPPEVGRRLHVRVCQLGPRRKG